MDNKKIDILNNMEVVYADGSEILCVIVEDNQKNRSKLIEIGYTENDIDKNLFEKGIDISNFASECGAIYYTGDKFIGSLEELFNDLKEAVDNYWDCVSSNLSGISDANQKLIALATQYVDAIKDFEFDEN